MSSEIHPASTEASAQPHREKAQLRVLGADEQPALLRWLDDGLRAGQRGRLEGEYGAALREASTRHATATIDGHFASHAMARCVRARAAGVEAPIGMIGLVYSDTAHRGRGLAARCIGRCEESLADDGAALAVLWSDRHDFYERLGYRLVGFETSCTADAAVCARALGERGAGLEVGPPDAAAWTHLEALYRGKPAHAVRPTGFLSSLASGPACRLEVARRGERPVAYAALGRGDDFPDTVHEWAGEPDGVLACLAKLLGDRASLRILSGPGNEPPIPGLVSAGAEPCHGGFALAKALRPEKLWRQLVAGSPELEQASLRRSSRGFRLSGPMGRCVLAPADVAQLLLGPSWPEGVRAALAPGQRDALERRVPWPLFVWGFDSI